MRVFAIVVCGLIWAGCGDDSTPSCARPADCMDREACVNGRCVLVGDDAGVDDAGMVDAADAEMDAPAEDAGEDSAVDANADTGVDAFAPDVLDAPLDAGPLCPFPDVLRPEPVVLYTFEAPDDATRIVDRAPADPDVPLVDNIGLFTIDNGGGGSVLFAAGRLTADQASSDQLVTLLRAVGSFTVEAWIRPENLMLEDESSPPERLVTLGLNHVDQAFVVGQHDSDIQARARTDQTGDSGFSCDQPPPAERAAIYAPGLDLASSHHVVLVFDATLGEPRVYVDGVVSGEDYPCGAGTLNWMTGLYRLALGDALVGNRQYEGLIQRVAIYARALDSAEIACWWAAGPDARVL